MQPNLRLSQLITLLLPIALLSQCMALAIPTHNAATGTQQIAARELYKGVAVQEADDTALRAKTVSDGNDSFGVQTGLKSPVEATSANLRVMDGPGPSNENHVSSNQAPYQSGLAEDGATAAGSATLSASNLNWAIVSVSKSGAPKSAILTNVGSASIAISSILISGTDPQDFNISNQTCGSSLGAGASCTVTLVFKPTAVGTRVALVKIAASDANSPHTVAVSGTAGPITARTPDITVDFGSRSGTQTGIPSGMLGAQYLAGDPYWGIHVDAVSQRTMVEAGFKTSRLHANAPKVYATTTPDWSKIDSAISSLQGLGVHPILEMDLTPPWLQPTPLRCPNNPATSVPADLNAWGRMAASYVAHFDKTFPGVVLDYEIWNEPNGPNLCSTNKLSDYLAIYAAAAPLMKAQAETDCKTMQVCASVRVGGPASAGVAMPSLLTDPRTAPYVDFYSYHDYVAGQNEIQHGMTWDIAGATPSLYSILLNSSSGAQAHYLQALAIVKAGKTPRGARTPIYLDEYNDDWSVLADCCRNSPMYSPLFNSLYVAQILNSTYAGATQLPTKMVYYSAANKPFCLVGTIDAAMDCASAISGATASPYPQLYLYKLISAPGYLDLVDGGHMASSVSLSSAAKTQGLVATAFYTANTESILITNPTAMSFSGVTVQVSNSGLAWPKLTLFILNSNNLKISSWPASVVSVTDGSQATFDIPPHSVLAVALRAN